MTRRLWRFLSVGILLLTATLPQAGCGNGGGDTTSGSLTLAIDKTAVNCGDVVVATVTLKTTSTAPVNGVKVRVMSADQMAIADATGSTNTSGVANIVLPAKWIASDKAVTLVAGADGVSQSTSQMVTVSAPKLVVNLPATNALSFKAIAGGGYGQVVMQGTSMSFKNGNGNPIAGQSINLYVDSITNKEDFTEVIFEPIQGSQIVAPPGFLTSVTEGNGTAQIPMKVTVRIPGVSGALSVMTVNWRAVTTYQGVTFTTTGSSQFTVTAS